MSDFLNSLIQRNVTGRVDVQPRLAAHFEPVREASSALHDPISLYREQTEFADQEQETRQREDPKHQAHPTPSTRASSEDAVRPFARPVSHSGEPSRQVFTAQTEGPTLQDSSSANRSIASNTADSAMSDVPPPGDTAIVSPRLDNSPQDAADGGSLLTPPHAAPDMTRFAGETPSVSSPTPFQVEPRQHEPIPQATHAAPVIRVTIGRIEVRAILPPAPPAPNPTTRSRPVLSLDDYLKQRRGDRK